MTTQELQVHGVKSENNFKFNLFNILNIWKMFFTVYLFLL
jgi:hypothetical protein